VVWCGRQLMRSQGQRLPLSKLVDPVFSVAISSALGIAGGVVLGLLLQAKAIAPAALGKHVSAATSLR
jgi:hypothetical protein